MLQSRLDTNDKHTPDAHFNLTTLCTLLRAKRAKESTVEEGLPELSREKMCVALTVPPKLYPDLWTSQVYLYMSVLEAGWAWGFGEGVSTLLLGCPLSRTEPPGFGLLAAGTGHRTQGTVPSRGPKPVQNTSTRSLLPAPEGGG